MEGYRALNLIGYQLGIINLLRLFQHLSVFSDENERERERERES